MDDQTPSAASYLRAFRAHWIDAMSGIASVPLAVAAVFVGEKYQQIVLWVASVSCLLIAGYRVWATERRKVIALDVSAKREAVRLRVAELITEGAGLRNEATGDYNPFSAEEMIGWCGRATAWHNVVLDTLKKVSAADAEWYRTLDVVPAPTIPLAEPPCGTDEDGRRLYAMHNFRLKKLEQLVSGEKGNLLVRR